jgi:hypothetical protein
VIARIFVTAKHLAAALTSKELHANASVAIGATEAVQKTGIWGMSLILTDRPNVGDAAEAVSRSKTALFIMAYQPKEIK